MSEYYAVVRSTDHLAHYGVKGMKWGVRKAIATGNQKKLDKHFRKAAKKLAKLQDIGLNPRKYAARAAAYGAAAAGTGTLAVAGAGRIGHAIKETVKTVKNKRKTAINPLNLKLPDNVASAFSPVMTAQQASSAIEQRKAEARLPLPEPDVYTKPIKIGATAATVGLGAAAVRNAYRAANAKRYRQKAVNFKKEMRDTFKNTSYAGKYVAEPKGKRRRKSK